MTHRTFGALVASLSIAALVLAANEAAARTGTGSRGGVASHSTYHHSAAQSRRHRQGNNFGTFWPAVGGYYDGPSIVEPMVDATQPAPGDLQYTNTYAIPWDWAHRFPPAVIPSERPYVSSCPTEAVTVTGRGGKEQTVNVTRCF